MLLNSLTGEITHMNSLSNDFYTGYKTHTTLVDGFHMPYYVEFREPELSYIWLHPLTSNLHLINPLNLLGRYNLINGVQEEVCFKHLLFSLG